MSCWLDSLLEPVERHWEWGVAIKSLIRSLLSGKVYPERSEALSGVRGKAVLCALWHAWGGFRTHGRKRVKGPVYAAHAVSLVTTISKVRDLQGLKSRETRALQRVLFVCFASCWALYVLYSFSWEGICCLPGIYCLTNVLLVTCIVPCHLNCPCIHFSTTVLSSGEEILYSFGIRLEIVKTFFLESGYNPGSSEKNIILSSAQ